MHTHVLQYLYLVQHTSVSVTYTHVAISIGSHVALTSMCTQYTPGTCDMIAPNHQYSCIHITVIRLSFVQATPLVLQSLVLQSLVSQSLVLQFLFVRLFYQSSQAVGLFVTLV